MTDLSSLGARTLGVWHRRDALALLGRASVAARLHSGIWQTVLPGVYADGGFVLTAEQWACAVTLASGDGAIACGRTAARVWGLPLIDDHDPATGACERFLHEVCAKGGRGSLVLAVRDGEPSGHEVLRRRLSLGPGEVVLHRGGFLLTSALRTAVECVRVVSFEAAVCLLDDGLRRGLFTTSELAEAVAARRGRAGSLRLASAVANADGRAESPAESLTRLLLRPIMPGLEPQVELRDEEGQLVARFDLADKDVKLAIESDGKRGHAGAQMVAKDRRRDRRSEALGWWTERVTWWELRTQQRQLTARLLARRQWLLARAAGSRAA